MRTEFVCEVCGGEEATRLGTRTYSRAAGRTQTEYQRKRLQVLFEIWCPGSEDVTFSLMMCRTCGFVSHLPRVRPTDVHAKYAAFSAWGQDYGMGESDLDADRRSRDLYQAVEAAGVLRRASPFRILDYGGGDGRLMRTFARAGHRTFLVDFNSSPVDGIDKLCDTVDQLPADIFFDLVVASHVLEHVSEPANIVRQLAAHVRPGGYLFVEVPMEIWGGPPLHEEPVTHVNFFVPGSLRRCLEAAALDVISCRLARCRSASGKYKLAVQAMSRKSCRAARNTSTGVDEVRTYLKPSLPHRIQRRLTLLGGLGGLVNGALRAGRMARPGVAEAGSADA
jgi:SAM-dependent methyltransferase